MNNAIFVTYGIMLSVLMFFAYKTFDPFHDPKFSTGQCIARFYEEEEFIPAHASDMKSLIVKVGKTNYLLQDLGYKSFTPAPDSRNIKWIDKDYIGVDCPKDNE